MIRYTIDIPQEALPELEELMRRHGAHFDPKRQVTAVNEAFMDSSTAMGHHIPSLIEGINHFLLEENLEPRVPENHREWDPAATQEFLELAVEQFKWENNTVTHAWWQEDQKSWDQVVRDHPRVFQ